MRSGTVTLMLQHYLLLRRSTDAVFSESTQAGHLYRGSAALLFGSSPPEAVTPLRTAPSLPTGQRTGVGPPQKVLRFPFLGAMLGFATTFQQ